MKNLYKPLFSFFILSVLITNLSAQITVDATSGTLTGSYVNLKMAFDSINIGTHQGDIIITVHASTTETATCLLDSTGNLTGSNYTNIFIKPADTATVVKTISYTTAGSAAISFRGAGNIVIDGRPLSSGSQRLLSFAHSGTTATSHVFSLTNGVKNFVVRYSSFTSAVTTAVVASNIFLGPSVLPLPFNNNIVIEYCKLTGGRAGVYLSSTATNPMDSIFINKNEFVDFANAAILSTTGSFKTVLIDSNSIYQTFNSATAPTGIDIRHNAVGTSLTITNNRIFDIQTATTNFIRGMVVSPATLSTGTLILIANNFISLTKNGGSGANIRGLEFGGAGDVTCRVLHNTILLGGTHTLGTTGQVVSVGLMKTNTSAGTNWVCRNNVSINNRTGGTAGLFHSAAWVSGNGASLTGTYDVDYNVYWATGGASNGPFPAVWNGTLQTQAGQTAYRNAAFPSEQNSLFNNVNFVSSTDLSLTGASINNYIIMGCPISGFVATDIFGTMRSNPAYKGAFESTPFSNLIDASVKEVYTLGKLPIPYAVPHIIRANIRNEGIDTIYSQQVNLAITGANTFTDSQIIDTLAPGQGKSVSFLAYSYLNTGGCLVTISVPSDSTNSNNSKSFNQTITNDVYGYAEPTLPAVGGVGFNGVGGDFIAKFPYTGANSINQVGVNFNTGGQPFQIVIFDILNDTPGTLLWNSATLIASAGVNTIPVLPAIGVLGSFFVGVRQTGITNVGFGYQAEDPIRDQTFYYKATTVSNWNDFASTNSAFRFMVEPRLQVADDIGPEKVLSPCPILPLNSGAFLPEIKVLNYGINTQSSIILHCEITGPTSYNAIDTFNALSLGTGNDILLTLSSLFNPNTAGTYALKVWTELIGSQDLSAENDTLFYSFVVSPADVILTAENALQLNGSTQSASANGLGSLNITGSMLSLETWINLSSTGSYQYIISKNESLLSPQYSLSVNAGGFPVFIIKTINGIDSLVGTTPVPLLAFSHLALTYNGLVGEVTLYLNGVIIGTKTVFGNLIGNNSDLLIGRGFNTGSFLSGILDEVRVWDTCLTASQIRNNLHTRLANFYHPNLKAYWRMDASSGVYTADVSGNCNAALLSNAPTFIASTIPLGAPAIFTQTISASGITNFLGSLVSMDIYNQSGFNDVYIHYFSGTPIGLQPTGVTSVNPNNWIIYRYGIGTMDSADVSFNTNGITLAANPSDFTLFNRGVGSSGNWVGTINAKNADPMTGKVTFVLLDVNFINQFAVGANNNSLPVSLLFFNAKNKSGSIDLSWATANETDNAGFHIERSVDGKRFIKISFVNGQGNSNKKNSYTLVDERAFLMAQSSTLYYRLVQTDFNGKQEISKTVMVSNDKENQFETLIYPNPFNRELTVSFDVVINTNATIIVMDITGKKLMEVTKNIEPGNSTIQVENLSKLNNGIYLLQTTINGEVNTQKIVKQ